MGRAVCWATLALIVAIVAGIVGVALRAPYGAPAAMIVSFLAWLPMYRALMVANSAGRR